MSRGLGGLGSDILPPVTCFGQEACDIRDHTGAAFDPALGVRYRLIHAETQGEHAGARGLGSANVQVSAVVAGHVGA